MKIRTEHLIKHETKKHQLIRFAIALLILLLYTIYLMRSYGADGLTLGFITWSAFVIATPLPDGGIILDFPIRLLTGIRMVFSEIFVWIVAISVNVYLVFEKPYIYEKTLVARSFHRILMHPWPDWSIILISLAGTFLGLYFGDELLDVITHSKRKKYSKFGYIYKFIFAIFGLALLYVSYKYFLRLFGIGI
ncbi:MAG: hypothetical protein V1814_03405 [Candidatus Moraniibacteriota bacterium]